MAGGGGGRTGIKVAGTFGWMSNVSVASPICSTIRHLDLGLSSRNQSRWPAKEDYNYIELVVLGFG